MSSISAAGQTSSMNDAVIIQTEKNGARPRHCFSEKNATLEEPKIASK